MFEWVRRPGLGVRGVFGRARSGPAMTLVAAVCLVAGASAPAADAAPDAIAPAGRTYERVTPAVNASAEVISSTALTVPAAQAAVSGDRLMYPTSGPYEVIENASTAAYRSVRTASGWQAGPILPPTAIHWSFDVTFIPWLSDDLSQEAITTGAPPLAPGVPSGYNTLYLRNLSDGSYDAVSTVAPPNVPVDSGFNSYFPAFAGMSADRSHVVFEAGDKLVDGAPPYPASSVYERVGGQLRLVGIRPDGSPDPVGSTAGASALGGNVRHAVSDDGSKIFWRASSDQQLFVRKDGTSTDWVSESQATTPDPNGLRPATFQCAAADGSQVYFTSASELTDDANTGDDGGGNPTDAGMDLYRYDVDSGQLTDVSVATDPADAAAGAAVQGVVGCSDDGARVYFVALGNLAPGAVSGQPNLYVVHGDAIEFIAPLSFSDSAVWSSFPRARRAAVPANGSAVAFTSSASIDGYDNTDPDTGAPYSQVYLYRVAGEELVCASCRRDGSRPRGASTLAAQSAFKLSRGVTADGGSVFFDSADALVRDDTNGRVDVYALEGDRLSLMSDGRQAFDARFMDASDSGRDVFFMTAAQLVAEDQDDVIDAYDARVGGGFPKPALVPPCAGDACQGPHAPAPSPSSPASSHTAGAGNVVTRRPTWHVARLSSAARRRLARTGRGTLAVRVSSPGYVTLDVAARIGKRTSTVAQRLAVTSKGGTLRLPIVLSRTARKALQRHPLRCRFTVRYSAVPDPVRTSLTLNRR